MPNNNFIWCPKTKGQKSIQVCKRCDETADCKEYQKHPLVDKVKKKGKNKVVVVLDETKKRAIALDEKVKEMKNVIFDTYFDLGVVLKEMRDDKLYGEFGYDNLEDYVQERHGFMYRKAAYLIAIVENCEMAGLQKDAVRGIEWSKMACLPQLTDENRQEWLGKAKDMTVEQLKNEVKKDRGDGESEEKIFLSFSLGAPAKDVVDRALNLAAQLTGSKVKSFHLEVLAQEFIGTYEKMDDASVTRFQSIYGDNEPGE